LIQYKALRSSSLIDLVIPSSPATIEQVQEAVQSIEDLGFKARLPSDISSLIVKNASHITKNDPNKKTEKQKYKFQHLKNALLDPDSEAIWCVRGGYGSQKLMPHLMKMKKPLKPKPLIGYSDATPLQCFLSTCWKWPVLHFPVLIHLKNTSYASLKRFYHLLKGDQKEQRFLNLKQLNKRMPYSQCIKSYVVGGNLTLLQSSIGTPWSTSFQNKILFIEDVGETPYRLDRALWQMYNAGVFKGVRALILGDFTFSDDKPTRHKQKAQVRQVFKSFSSYVSFPVIEGVPCGHGQKKECIPFMTSSVLEIKPGQKTKLFIKNPYHNA